MNHLVLDVYKHLGKPKKRLFHFPFALAYLGGKCFDIAAFILHRKFAINSIRVKKFTQNTYFRSSRVPETGFKAPVELEEGLRRTIDYEFVRKTEGARFPLRVDLHKCLDGFSGTAGLLFAGMKSSLSLFNIDQGKKFLSDIWKLLQACQKHYARLSESFGCTAGMFQMYCINLSDVLSETFFMPAENILYAFYNNFANLVGLL